MARKVNTYKTRILRALKKAGKYDPGLLPMVDAMANTMRTLDICSGQIDGLEEATVLEKTRYGEKLAPHPVFKVQRDAQESLVRLCKSVGLTYAELMREAGGDGYSEFMEKMREGDA